MPSLGCVTVPGKSGKAYKFRAYPLGTVFKKGLAGVFILTQRSLRETTGGMRHRPLFLGQSADLRQPDDEASKAFSGTTANCVCVHSEPDAYQRQAIRDDLVETCPGPEAGS